MDDVPVLETARLRLRAHRLDDYEAACAMWSDPAVTQFIGGKPSTRQQTWSRMLGYAGHWKFLKYGYWAIEERESAQFAGELGFADFKRDIVPAMQGFPELGFALAAHAHGRGYATEAVRAAIAWADAHLSSRRTVSLADEQNTASLHVLRKAGYREFDRGAFNERTVLYFERIVR